MNIENFEYAITFDDGKKLEDIQNSDVIILGPSRAGKTPLCFYLAFFNIKACNIPIVPNMNIENILSLLPKNKLFGLIRSTESLQSIRKTRSKYLGVAGDYINPEKIFEELENCLNLYNTLKIPVIDMDKTSIEEASIFIQNRIQVGGKNEKISL